MPAPPKATTPAESTEAVNVYRTSAVCPIAECGGSMLPDGYSTPLTGPLGPDSKGRILYRHACATCAAPGWYFDTYPKMAYVSAAAEQRLAEAAKARAPKGAA